MDPKPLEIQPPKSPKTQEQQPNEIILDRETAKALGRGLRQQIFTKEELMQIKTNIIALEQNDAVIQTGVREQTAKEEQWIKLMSIGLQHITNFIFNLEHAKEIKLSISGKGKTDYVFFSEEKEELEKPKEGEITVDQKLTTELKSALQHHLGTQLTVIRGFAELIEFGYEENSAKEKAKGIRNAYESIYDKFVEMNNGDQIKLVTDSEGNTDIVPLQTQPQEPQIG